MTLTRLRPQIGGVLLAAALTACGGVSADASAPSSGSSGTVSPTLAQQIEALEGKGGYSTLDRSADIAGPDTNKNGVRDDIEAWINTLNVTESQRKALIQKAKSLQQTLVVDLENKDAVRLAGEGLMASNKCGASQFAPYQEFSALRGRIEAMTANTRERAMRYMQYNKARSGSSTTFPSGDTCEP